MMGEALCFFGEDSCLAVEEGLEEDPSLTIEAVVPSSYWASFLRASSALRFPLLEFDSISLPFHVNSRPYPRISYFSCTFCLHYQHFSKIVVNSADSVIVSDATTLLVFQYFENVRNFLVSIEEIGLPAFETSDFE
ncbi:Kinesin-4 [Platanthera zijinensis]|uniref:Kinesin-4 n=1 Tax=Platanthera zijinensis TaxID=2320716 RepID=A0AAP0BP13_9ASPA